MLRSLRLRAESLLGLGTAIVLLALNLRPAANRDRAERHTRAGAAAG